MNELEEAVIDFFAHIEDYSSIDSCWIWRTGKASKDYGYFKGAGISTKAHRWIWAYLHGPISVRRVIHHKCHVKRCVNPMHLECLSIGSHRMLHTEIVDMRTQNPSCRRGHLFDEENTYLHNGHRLCKECRREYKKEWRRRNG